MKPYKNGKTNNGNCMKNPFIYFYRMMVEFWKPILVCIAVVAAITLLMIFGSGENLFKLFSK